MNRAARAAYWIVPSAFLVALYWWGLLAWFQQDDFAWLGLKYHLRGGTSLATTLFAPMAQGTIRPLSERAFFLVFEGLFGLNALPFRIWVFLTQIANLVLLSLIARRLTGSRLAGFLAPILWTANSNLSTALSWTSTYNQILCGFFMLLSFWLLLRYIDTGQARYYIAQWLSFLAGFGALEINVVYPALAIGYAALAARQHLVKLAPLVVPSAVFTIAHRWMSPRETVGTYAMYFDADLFRTLAQYGTWAMGPSRLEYVGQHSLLGPIGVTATVVVAAALTAFVAWQVRRGRWLALFLLGWFVVLIAPLLPLKLHVTEYYLTLPTAGLAILGAWGVATAWSARRVLRWSACAVATVYLATSAPIAWTAARWRYERSMMIHDLVWGVARARELHPNELILLAGVSSDLFWGGLVDHPFRLVGVSNVFLAPGAEQNIDTHPDLGDPRAFVLPHGPARRALDQGRAIVYAVSGGRLRNVTPVYQALAQSWKIDIPQRVDVGQAEFASQLGRTWHAIEGQGHRWMPKRATVLLGGPQTANRTLTISGFCSRDRLKDGPVALTVAVDGRSYPPVRLTEPEGRFRFSFPLAPETVGKESVEVSLEVDRTFVVPGDGRALGVVFGVFEIR